MNRFHLVVIAAIALPVFNGFGQSVVSPVTVALTVSNPGTAKETTDKNGNVTKSVTKMIPSKISNATILNQMVTDGEITATKGYSLVLVDGALNAYSKTGGYVPSGSSGFDCQFGVEPSPSNRTETWSYDAEGTQKTHSLASSGVKTATLTTPSGELSGSGTVKVGIILTKDGSEYPVESGTYNFLTTDSATSTAGKVTLGAGKLVTQ